MVGMITGLEILDILRRKYPYSTEQIQELKSEADGFQPLWDGIKTFDNRRTADRTFEAGQILVHHEWNNGATEPLGRFVITVVTFVADRADWGIREGWVAMGIKTIAKGVTARRAVEDPAVICDSRVYYNGFRVRSVYGEPDLRDYCIITAGEQQVVITEKTMLEVRPISE